MKTLKTLFYYFLIIDFQKLVNILGCYLTFFTKKTNGKALPFAVSIEPTTSCNLRCPQCISGLRNFTRPVGMLDIELYKKMIDQVKNHVLHLNLYFQGEPYLNPQFFEMVKYASSNKIFVMTSTNAHFLSLENALKTVESGLNKLIISIDGTSQETYQKYRIGGELDKVKQGIENIIEAKKQLKNKRLAVVLQFVIFKHNQHEIEEIKAFAKKHKNIDFQLKTAQIYDYEQDTDFIPTETEFARYKKNALGTFELKHKIENKCWKMWHSAVITWDGTVVPCCFDKDANHAMGNIKNLTFSEIWKSQNYKNFRNQLLENRTEIQMCKNCTEGASVFA
ncbi:MAG: radical SAM protein [Bacteroidetes bacterium]|nr:MAG: radical SAM protein [Bacteroidota bacterium]